MSDDTGYTVNLDGFSSGQIPPPSLVWMQPTGNVRQLKKQVTAWLERKHAISVPARCHIYVNHEERIITLKKMVDEPKVKASHKVVHIDKDLLASILC